MRILPSAILFCISWFVFLRAGAQENRLKQKTNIDFTAETFDQVLSFFEEKSDCFFQYDASLKPINKNRFKLNYHNMELQEIMHDFLQKYGLDYALVGFNSLVLKKWIPPKIEVVLSGRVSHATTKERLVNASISVIGTNRITFTNDQGIFQLRTDIGRVIYTVYYPGFELYTDTIESEERVFFMDVDLMPETDRMEITYVVSENTKSEPLVQLGKSDEFSINKKQLDRIPSIFGETDVLRIMSLNPGVVSGSEGVFGMYVRGGAADQNLILLDEVPVYNPYHLYGMFGVFNGDMVKNAKFYRGVFPAEKGGRLSSVIDIQTREGSTEKVNASLNLGILSSKLYLGGPLFSNKTTYSVAFRRSAFDYLVLPVSSLFQFSESNLLNRYYFYDINAKITHRFSAKSRLTMSAYYGLDYAGLVEAKDIGFEGNKTRRINTSDISSWGNKLVNVRWDKMLTPTSTFSIRSFYTNYTYSHNHNYSNKLSSTVQNLSSESSTYSLSNGLSDWEISSHLKKQVNAGFSYKMGGGYVLHYFQPNTRVLSTDNNGAKTLITFNDIATITPEIFGYISCEWNSEKFGYYDFGVRSAYYGLGFNQYYVLPEPRFSARYHVGNQQWIKINASLTRQFFHQLNNLTMGLPSDLWVPSNSLFEPAKALQTAIGYSKSLGAYQLSSEVFLKKFSNLLEYNSNSVYTTSGENWTQSVTAGSGMSEGWELLIEKNKGRLTGWISYTLMKSTRLFNNLNQGKEFPSRYDRRHNIYVVASYKFNNSHSMNASWIFNSGFAYTQPIGVYPSGTHTDPFYDVYIYGDRNNQRSLNNHRLDLSYNFTGKWYKFQRTWSFGIYNVYNNKNPFYVNMGVNSNGERKLFQVSLLPFLPYINFQLTL